MVHSNHSLNNHFTSPGCSYNVGLCDEFSVMRKVILLLVLTALLPSCGDDEPVAGSFELTNAFAGALALDLEGSTTTDVPVDRNITLTFSAPVDESSLTAGIRLSIGNQPVAISTTRSSQETSVAISTVGTLEDDTRYTVTLTGELKSTDGRSLAPLSFDFQTSAGALELLSVDLNGQEVINISRAQNVPIDLSLTFRFSAAIDATSLGMALSLNGIAHDLSFSDDHRQVIISSTQSLEYLRKYEINLANSLTSAAGGSFEGFSMEFYTMIDPRPKFPIISDEALLTKVQQETFRYFWDFAHPASGMARERNSSGNLVTVGGSGFGLMTILVGIERGFISRGQGIERINTIVNFLKTADRFHGVWPHWLNGNTGEVIPFSANDNGGDLVETALMIQGLLTVRQYLNPADNTEASIMANITQLWEEVEWDWHTRGGQNVLYWHWSPDFGWQKNLRIAGWNESLIVYVLAAASPTHPIDPQVYHEGWARNGDMANGNNYYGIELPLGPDRGGPLFFSHYSSLGLDPRNLEDQYANYWTQNLNHTLVNRAYCVDNPLNYIGYGTSCWGLTASDGNSGYSAHSPANDRGVITPTAALSAFPYTPVESMEALKHFYYQLGDRLWGEYGFFDAFNLTENWTANSYLAIDQGPIIIMIENYRSGLLWDTFMKDTEVKAGLDRLGFDY